MAKTRTVKTDFSAGELSPLLRGRIDLDKKYSGGTKVMSNFVPLLEGGASFRSGFKHLATAKGGSSDVRLVTFAPNSIDSFTIEFGHTYIRIFSAASLEPFQEGETSFVEGAPLVIKRKDLTTSSVITTPYLANEIDDLWVSFDVDVMIITHPNHEPRKLEYWEAPLGFDLEVIPFTATPFTLDDITENLLTVSGESHITKLVSNSGSWLDEYNGEAYIEFSVNGVKTIGRVLDTTTTPIAPASPINDTAYVEPVMSIVNDIPTSAVMVYLEGPNEGIVGSANQIRSDTLVFNYDMVDAYIRISNDFNELNDPTLADESIVWAKITKYVGPKDFPTEFVSGAINALETTDFTVGHIYEITKEHVDVNVSAPSGTDLGTEAADFSLSFRFNTVGDTFQWANYSRINPDGGTGDLKDLSTLQTFDVVEVDTKLSVFSGPGNVRVDTVYEKFNHTATMESSEEFFYDTRSNPRGLVVGQFIYAKHGPSDRVLYEISSINHSKSATVLVKDGSIPRKKSREDILDDGHVSVFRTSVWKEANYPYVSTFYEDRLVFAGTPSHPETFWMSKLKNNYDFRTVENDGTVLATTGISYNIKGPKLNRIIFIDSYATLIIGTQSTEWQVKPNTFGEALTPTNIRVTHETAIGATNRVVRVGSSLLFIDRSRRRIREYTYDFQFDGFEAVNMNILSEHIFKIDPAIDICYQEYPTSIVWIVTASGKLVSMTYDKRQKVYSWARHDLGGKVVSCSVLPRAGLTDNEDQLIVAVEREPKTSQYIGPSRGVVYLESYGPVFTDDGTDNFKKKLNFFDSYVRFPSDDSTYLTSPTSVVSGLSHLDGVTVGIVIDGSYVGTGVSDSGIIQLPKEAKKYVLVGRAITGVLTDLPTIAPGLDGPSVGNPKRVTELSVYLHNGMTIEFAPEGLTTQMLSFRDTTDPMDESPKLFTGFKELEFPEDFDLENAVTIKHTRPYPQNILLLVKEVDVS